MSTEYWAKKCAEKEVELERLRERCEAYKGQVEAGAAEIERLRKALDDHRAIKEEGK